MESKKLKLISKEGETFIVDSLIMNMSGFLKDMLEDREDYSGEDIHVPAVPASIMKDIIEYCEHFNFKNDRLIPSPLPSNNLS